MVIVNRDRDKVNNNADASCNVGGSSIFIFKIDKKEVYKSAVLTGKDSAVFVEFDIPSNSKELEIIINSSLDGSWCDRPAIGDAKLISDETIVNNQQISVKPKNKLTTTWAEMKQ